VRKEFTVTDTVAVLIGPLDTNSRTTKILSAGLSVSRSKNLNLII